MCHNNIIAQSGTKVTHWASTGPAVCYLCTLLARRGGSFNELDAALRGDFTQLTWKRVATGACVCVSVLLEQAFVYNYFANAYARLENIDLVVSTFEASLSLIISSTRVNINDSNRKGSICVLGVWTKQQRRWLTRVFAITFWVMLYNFHSHMRKHTACWEYIQTCALLEIDKQTMWLTLLVSYFPYFVFRYWCWIFRMNDKGNY